MLNLNKPITDGEESKPEIQFNDLKPSINNESESLFEGGEDDNKLDEVLLGNSKVAPVEKRKSTASNPILQLMKEALKN